MVQCLLDNNANPNLTGDTGYTPLEIATQHGCLEIVKALLKHPQIDVNAGSPYTALYRAISYKSKRDG